ncbi:hypothetical protein EF834_13605 [Rhodococcus spongiicola]|uniref:Uncharacterized protein n=2 Tax=Rhodococcus spongiicola TaxID=2487352 RepID=A0A438ARZ2_9NOCA|nr:hypothetical protein EF834_13605 [Rhodococcus spongiicola]
MVSDQFAGDWQALQVAGKSLEGLAEFNTLMAKQLSSAKETALESWSGEAAAEAERYFSELSEVVGRQSHAIRGMAEQLDQTSVGMYEASEAIKDLVGMLVDTLIVAGIQFAAALLTGGSVVGAPAAAGLLASALLMAKRAWDIVGNIQKWLGVAWAGAQATIGLVAGHLATVKDKPLPELPSSAYQFGGV